jgi:DNA-binding MarR family transcriptional regulator
MSEHQSAGQTGGESLDLDVACEELNSDFTAAVARLYRRLRTERDDGQISDTHRSVLNLLVSDGPHTLGELSDHEHVKPPSMNQTVNFLEQSGYVERMDDSTDGRKVILVATSRGVALIEETRRRRHAWLKAKLEELSPDERQILSAASGIIRRITDS